MIEQINESICEEFDNREPRYQDRMILHLVSKVRQLIDEVNRLKTDIEKVHQLT